MRFTPILLGALLLIGFVSAAVVYNDPEIFWVREHHYDFQDPKTGKSIAIYRISNDQLKIYLQDNRVRSQLDLEPLYSQPQIRTPITGPSLVKYYKRFVTEKDLSYVRNNFDRIFDPINEVWVSVQDLSDATLRSLLHYPEVRNQLGLDATKSQYLQHGTSAARFKPMEFPVSHEHILYVRQHFRTIQDPNLQRSVLVSDLTNAQMVRLLQNPSVRQATGVDQAFPPAAPPAYGPVLVPEGLRQKFRVLPSYPETEWIYRQTMKVHDPLKHTTYHSNYLGDENLYDTLYNLRKRYIPWGRPKYYD